MHPCIQHTKIVGNATVDIKGGEVWGSNDKHCHWRCHSKFTPEGRFESCHHLSKWYKKLSTRIALCPYSMSDANAHSVLFKPSSRIVDISIKPPPFLLSGLWFFLVRMWWLWATSSKATPLLVSCYALPPLVWWVSTAHPWCVSSGERERTVGGRRCVCGWGGWGLQSCKTKKWRFANTTGVLWLFFFFNRI